MKRKLSYLFICILLSSASTLAADVETLRVLTWDGYSPKTSMKKFEDLIEKKYKKKIKVEVKYVGEVNEFFEALRGKTSDIIAPAHNCVKDKRFQFIKKRLVMPIDLNKISNYKDIIPALKNASYLTDDKGLVYGIPITHGPYGLAYNTDKVKEPKSWNVLWDPKNAGKISISADHYESNLQVTGLVLGMKGTDFYSYDKLNNPKVIDKLKALSKNVYSTWYGVDTADHLQGNHYATSWGFSLPELKKRGENWKIADPIEGTMGFVDNYLVGAHVAKNDFKKKVALEFLNFTLSPEFQVEVLARGIGSSPVNLNVKNLLSKKEIKQFHIDEPEYFKKNRIMWPTLDKRNRNGLKRLWKKAVGKDMKSKKDLKQTKE